MKLILEQVGATSTTPGLKVTSGPAEVGILVAGDFDGGLLFMQVSADNEDWVTVATLFRSGFVVRTIPDEVWVRLRFVGGGTPLLKIWSTHDIPS